MNKLWTRISISFVIVFFVAVMLPIVLFGLLDSFHVIDIQQISFTRIQSLVDNQLERPLIARFPHGLIEFLLFSGLIGITAGTFASRQIAKPIAQMAEAAHKIGEKDFETRLEMKGADELESLADAFNQMAIKLDEGERLRQNMLADVSHELRTPLTVLEGQLRAALDGVMSLDDEELANLYNQTHHLIRLVNELHELAQVEAHQLPLEVHLTSIAPLLDEVVDVFQPIAAEQQVTIKLEMPERLPAVQIDTYRIRQSLHNLIANALRYTHEGGEIVVRAVARENWLVLEVQDDGEGIADEHIAYIFDRFYRADSSRARDTGGTGLGLAIVKAIVEAHGGEVQVFSAGIGTGSTFSILLPL